MTVSYGENLGTNTLARELVTLSKSIYHDLDCGEPWDEIAEDAKSLMEGAMELWERMVMESE